MWAPLPEEIRVRVLLTSDRLFTLAGFARFIEQFEQNYAKHTTVLNICSLFAAGFRDANFKVSVRSADLFPSEDLDENRTDRFVDLTTKASDARRFWYYIRTLSRPVVFFREDDVDENWSPLYSFSGPDALKFEGSLQSPPFLSFEGFGSSINDLLYGAAREERESDRHAQEMIREGARTLGEIVRTSEIIESPDVPSGVKQYARMQHALLMKRQEELNRRLAIKIKKIDVAS